MGVGAGTNVFNAPVSQYPYFLGTSTTAISEENISPTSNISSESPPASTNTDVDDQHEVIPITDDPISGSTQKEPSIPKHLVSEKVVINTSAQDKLENEIKALHYQIDELVKFKDSGFATDINLKQLKDCRTSVFEKKKQLNIVIGNARRQREQRKRRSEVLRNIAAESEENAAKLKSFTREKPGRPPVEDTYPDLHNVIVQIATATAGADGKRRTDILEACHTLDDLRAALRKEGYVLSRNALYLRLVPRRSDSNEGKNTFELFQLKYGDQKIICELGTKIPILHLQQKST